MFDYIVILHVFMRYFFLNDMCAFSLFVSLDRWGGYGGIFRQ